MDDIKQDILELIDNYKKFMIKKNEYQIVNEKIKKELRNSKYKKVVEYYSLKLKITDVSKYSDELIPYLLEQKLENFLIVNVDEVKLSKLVKDGVLDINYVYSNIEEEKTLLDIIIKNLDIYLSKCKNDFEKSIRNYSLFELVKKREVIKEEINLPRGKYYSLSKKIKDILSTNELTQYRFEYNKEVGMVKIKIKSRKYSKEFIEYLVTNDIDAIKLTVDSVKLLKSKSKKINKQYINKYKIEEYKETLYVYILKNILEKKQRKINS